MKNHKELYFKIVDLWEELCQKHNYLFDLTIEEYSFLLNSDIDSIEKINDKKKTIIQEIQTLENSRKSLIQNLNTHLDEKEKINSSKELLAYMLKFEEGQNFEHLKQFNQFLIDIIEKTHNQNKKNQSFLFKAIESLREIRDEFLGEKSFPFYTSQGKTISMTL